MPVVETDLKELKASIDLVNLVLKKGIALKKQGKQFVGLCPFHPDTNPSLIVDTKTQLWHCFGCPDNKGGDVFSFLQELEKISFSEAVHRLREETQRKAPAGNPGHSKKSSINRQALLNRVSAFYHDTFYTDPRGLEYLQSRHLHEKEAYDSFQVGFANGSLLSAIPEFGEMTTVLTELGILTKRGTELFQDCVTFPITNEDNQVVGMYGRKVNPESAVQHLYLPGPHRGVLNFQAAHRSKEIILTESILDCLSLYQAGFKDCIPMYGTNGFTADHLQLLAKHGIEKVYCCLDNDEAGRAAAKRISEKLKPLNIITHEIVLPVKDANDYFKEHTSDDFLKLIEESERLTNEPEKTLVMDDGFSLTLSGIVYQVRVFRLLSDQLRVNLKATFGESFHTDTFDFYAHKSRQSFVNTAAKKFKLSCEELEKHLNKLLVEAELFQKQHTPESVKEKKETPTLTQEEHDEALRFLQSPTLADDILKDLEACGYVGESSNKLLAYLIGISRKLESPLSGIIISQSGAGKSQLAELIESLTPPEDVVLYSRLSPQALCYMEKDFLKRKLLIVEEKTGSEAADYSIRTLQTRAKITQGVVMKDPQTGRMYTKTTTVEGPIAYLVTTTSSVSLNHENLTRCFEIELDESKEQTLRIQELQRQAKTLAGLIRREKTEAVRKKHHHAQQLLKTVKVVIPFAPALSFPSEWLRSRRDHFRFLSLIEAVTFLYQHQREKKTTADEHGNQIEYIESTLEDYTIAYDLAKEILGHTFAELKKGAQELLSLIEEWVTKRAGEKSIPPSEVVFTRRDVREYSSWPDHRLKESFKELEELEYVTVVSAKNGKQSHYQMPEIFPEKAAWLSGLTTPEELEEKLTGRKPVKTGSKVLPDAVLVNR